MTSPANLEGFYNYLWPREASPEDPYRILDEVSPGRSRDALIDLVRACGVGPGSTVLDIGCGLGGYTCRLAAELGCSVTSIDALEQNLQQARERAEKRGLADRIRFMTGVMEALPFGDSTFRFIWCSDTLSHVEPLQAAFHECARVLTPGGSMLLYCALATGTLDPLDPEDLQRMCPPMAVFPGSLSQPTVEAAIQEAGLQIALRESTSDERSPYFEPLDGSEGRDFMRLARLLREKEHFTKKLGADTVSYLTAHYLWNALLLLGKLDYYVYLLQKPLTGYEAGAKIANSVMWCGRPPGARRV